MIKAKNRNQDDASIRPTTDDSISWEYAIENAIAQQRLEGLEVSPETIAEMHRLARGEITIADGIRSTFERHSHSIQQIQQ